MDITSRINMHIYIYSILNSQYSNLSLKALLKDPPQLLKDYSLGALFSRMGHIIFVPGRDFAAEVCLPFGRARLPGAAGPMGPGPMDAMWTQGSQWGPMVRLIIMEA
jgi:hypothetical protein